MNNEELINLTLHNFEGPIEFLLQLIQKKEIDIYEISIREVIEQFLSKFQEKLDLNVSDGAEFIGSTSFMVWLKAKMLLPKQEQILIPDVEIDPQFTIIHQLIEYCKFKDAAKDLSEREKVQSNYYLRGGLVHIETPKSLGIQHLTVDELKLVFQNISEKNKEKIGIIEEDECHISDKITFIKNKLKTFTRFQLDELFEEKLSKIEIIVTFLAILELMKLNIIKVYKDQYIYIESKDL
ncbi:MAG: hypothetical protein BGO10_01570 [Chlamydia sp. 32-24]|nr:MAG: hypothetical protein BGO10_01570 [Chlamydia sp. 32-24]